MARLENNLAAAKVSHFSRAGRTQLDEMTAIPPVFPYTVLNKPDTWQGFAGSKHEQFDAPSEPIA